MQLFLKLIDGFAHADKHAKANENPEAEKDDDRILAYNEKVTVLKKVNTTILIAIGCEIHVPRRSSLTVLWASRCKIIKEPGAHVRILVDDQVTTTESQPFAQKCGGCGGPLPENGKCEYCGCIH